jgi:hypothetical protein
MLDEPFQRGTRRIRTDDAGVGLGLAIVKSITQAHDGPSALADLLLLAAVGVRRVRPTVPTDRSVISYFIRHPPLWARIARRLAGKLRRQNCLRG